MNHTKFRSPIIIAFITYFLLSITAKAEDISKELNDLKIQVEQQAETIKMLIKKVEGKETESASEAADSPTPEQPSETTNGAPPPPLLKLKT